MSEDTKKLLRQLDKEIHAAELRLELLKEEREALHIHLMTLIAQNFFNEENLDAI